MATMVKMDNGKSYYARECFKNFKHDAHAWVTHSMDKKPTPLPGEQHKYYDNAWCEGTGIVPKAMYIPKAPPKEYKDEQEKFPHSTPITPSQARKIAFDMHSTQKDKSGHPYTEHLAAVEMGVKVLGGSHEERVAALFHDAVEDGHTTYAILRSIGVTEHSIVMIEAVSKRNNEAQHAYLERVKKAGHGACRVKLADLLHNTRHDRIQALRDNKQGHTADRLLKKYRPSIAALMLYMGMIVDEDTQKKLAVKPQGTAGGYGYSSPYSTNKVPAAQQGTLPAIAQDSWPADSVFPGDWVLAWSAPVLKRLHDESDRHHTFLLCDGTVQSIAKTNVQKFKVATYKDWNGALTTLPYSAGAQVTMDDVEVWAELLAGREDPDVDEGDDDEGNIVIEWELPSPLDTQDEHGKYLWDSGAV